MKENGQRFARIDKKIGPNRVSEQHRNCRPRSSLLRDFRAVLEGRRSGAPAPNFFTRPVKKLSLDLVHERWGQAPQKFV